MRFTIRLRLTLWYGGLFIIVGILMLTLNYFLVRDSLASSPDKARAVVAQRLHIPSQLLDPRTAPFGFNPDERILVNGVPVGRLIDEVQKELHYEALRQLMLMSGVALAVMAMVSLGLGWLVSGRMLRPLKQITNTARRLSESTLHERIALKGPRDELKDLADTFDEMLGRLDTAFQAQKDFVANASHEMRTPLTIIRTEIDVALADPEIDHEELNAMGEAVRDAVGRSERLIDGLLVLARTDTAIALNELDLSDLARQIVEMHSQQADSLGLSLELDLQSAPVTGDPALLERLVGNLVENAIQHNQAGGWFTVKTGTQGNQALLTVANSGPVVPPEDAERLFDRFFRPDRSRSRKTGGVGLGLSIVKAVATAHGGTAAVTAPPSGGLEVRVSLPAAPPVAEASDSSSSPVVPEPVVSPAAPKAVTAQRALGETGTDASAVPPDEAPPSLESDPPR